MKEPINPALVRVTGDDMVTGVITMKEALEREVDKMRPVYDAAMAASEAWANKFKQNHSPESRQRFEDAMDTLAILCRRAKEGK